MGVLSIQTLGFRWLSCALLAGAFLSSGARASVQVTPASSATHPAYLNAGEYRSAMFPEPNVGGLVISPGPLSLVSSPPRDPAPAPTLTATAVTAAPGAKDVPAAIPIAPAAPLGGLTLLVLAVPMFVNRRLRHWLLR